MAPIGESTYFPALDKCLDGGSQLFSWKTVFTGLSQSSHLTENKSLERHLTDDLTVDLLVRAFQPFELPTAQTRAAFETKTSAVNVTPSSHGRYDIKQIKDDAVWLSKETSIDEVSALRIVVVEWQIRPANELLQGVLGELVLASQERFLSRGLRVSLAGTTIQPKNGADNAPFSSLQCRRMRLLDLYLSERRYIIKSCEYIISCVLYGTASEGLDRYGDLKHRRPAWLGVIANHIMSIWNLDGTMKTNSKNFFVNAVEALKIRLESLEQGSQWTVDDDSREEAEVAWSRNQILEMIHVMQIVLVLLESSPRLMRSDAIISWFRLMRMYGFFERFELPHQSLDGVYDFPFQSLISLVSVAILNVPLALDALDEFSTFTLSSAEHEDGTLFLLNPAIVHEIHEILMETAYARVVNSSPAVFAWVIIMQTLRDHALKGQEVREIRQSQRAVDNYGAPDSSDNDSLEELSTRRQPSPHRRSSIGSDTSQTPMFLEEVLARIMDNPADQDPISFLAKSSLVDTHVFELVAGFSITFCTEYGSEHDGESGLKTRSMLLDLIKAAVQWLDYQPEIILAALAVLTGSEQYREISRQPLRYTECDPIEKFLNDETLMQRIYVPALSRFPYEYLPFLKLCRALATYRSVSDDGKPDIGAMLESIRSFTCSLSEDVAGYRLSEMNNEYVEVTLTTTLDWFCGNENTATKLSYKPANEQNMSGTTSRALVPFQIEENSTGQVLTNGKPLVVMWNHEYSGLKFLGMLLQRASNGRELPTVLDPTDSAEIVSEIIGLITALLSSTVEHSELEPTSGVSDTAKAMLEEASELLDRNQDIVSVIFAIFEDELYKHISIPNSDYTMDLLVQCIHFVHALIPVLPGRVWPFLTRSCLLGVDGKESRLAFVVANREVALGRFDFLLGCINVFDALVEDTVVRAVSRKDQIKAVMRFSDMDAAGTGISDVMMKKVLLCMEKIMVDVIESISNWRFVSQAERFEINARICTIFQRVLEYCFAVDDSSDTSCKLTGLLAPTADYLVDVFLSKDTNNLLLQPLCDILREGIATPHTTLPTRGLHYWTSQVVATLRLCTALVQLNRYLGNPPGRLEEQLFGISPVLTQLYAVHDSYRLPTIELFNALVRSVNKGDLQPPSLLGYLGHVTGRCFLDLLSTIGTPLDNEVLSESIWRLLSAIVSQRQQWFAIFLFTGNTPRDTLKRDESSNNASAQRRRSLLQIALESLSDIGKLSPKTSASMLEFVALAIDFWPWVMSDLKKDSRFLNAITGYLAQMQSRSGASESGVDYYQIQNASFITNIIAMYLQHSHQGGDNSFARTLLPSLAYLSHTAVSMPAYNVSLHRNLARNFESRYPNCSLLQFKRTTLIQPLLGQAFFYDINIGAKMLNYDSAWTGKNGDGFEHELFRANMNFSLVEAQVNLFQSWKFLAVEISVALSTELELHKSLVPTIQGCLISNRGNNMPQPIFDRLAQSRADLAFALLQRFIEVAPYSSDVKSILTPAWDLMHSQDTDLGTALVGTDAEYNRTLLKIVYLSLQAHTAPLSKSNSSNTPTTTTSAGEQFSPPIKIVLEILSVIVARGFRSLTATLHDDPSRVLPTDFALITAILRTCLCIPSVNRHTAQLLSHFADDRTAQYACTLLSWSDQLALNHDPIYGELSIMFLLELSSVPALAESIAMEGILTQIATSNLMIYFRRPHGTGPFDEPLRIYNIWCWGILPLLLNMLVAIGAPIAAEIAAFLHQFRPQLARATSNFDTKHMIRLNDTSSALITLSMASEAHTIALISTILGTIQVSDTTTSDIADIGWGKDLVKDDVDGWTQRRTTLRESIIATNEREEHWSRMKASNSQSGAENRLEEKVVKELNAIRLIINGEA